MTQPARSTKISPRQIVVHALRVGMLAAILLFVRLESDDIASQQPPPALTDVSLASVQTIFPQATSLGKPRDDIGGQEVLAKDETSLGYVVQTSPQGDQIIGFSGPTNLLIGFDVEDAIVGLVVISSKDTSEHVEQVVSAGFLDRFHGGDWENPLPTNQQIDGVSGATLTSLAIAEAVLTRLQGERPTQITSLRFSNPVAVAQAKTLFPQATAIEPPPPGSALWQVIGADGKPLGEILRTSPASDQIIGYQGPTEAFLGVDQAGKVIGLAIGKSYDNDEYVGYVRDDDYFLKTFNDKSVAELAELDLFEEQVEGVSGATMTSLTVADGLVAAAQKQQAWTPPIEVAEPPATFLPRGLISLRNIAMVAMIILAMVVGFTSLRSNRWVRFGYPILLIVVLGLLTGDMVSQAMIAGWAQNGIPWKTASGLVLLTAAAMLVPIFTKRNLYCSHLCPHGAVQQLLKNRIKTKVRLSEKLVARLKLIPAMLLAFCLIVVAADWPLSLVGIEPFDAWHFQIAGWATIAVAIVGLVASLFVPMAYCRYGCPTGAMLNYLRFSAKADQWGPGDWLALLLALVAAAVWLF